MFFVFGLIGLFHLAPEPAGMPDRLMALMNGFKQSIYLFPLISGTQVVVGSLLLTNRFVPLALVLLAPVLVNIIAVHIFLQPAGIGPGAVALLLAAYLVWSYRDAYRPMLAARARPATR